MVNVTFEDGKLVVQDGGERISIPMSGLSDFLEQCKEVLDGLSSGETKENGVPPSRSITLGVNDAGNAIVLVTIIDGERDLTLLPAKDARNLHEELGKLLSILGTEYH